MTLADSHKLLGYVLIIVGPALVLACLGGLALREDRASLAAATEQRGLVIVEKLRAFRDSLEEGGAAKEETSSYRLELMSFDSPAKAAVLNEDTVDSATGLSPAKQADLETRLRSLSTWQELGPVLESHFGDGHSRAALATWLLEWARSNESSHLEPVRLLHRALVEYLPAESSERGTPIGLISLLWLIDNARQPLDATTLVGRIAQQVAIAENPYAAEYLSALGAAIRRRIASSGSELEMDSRASLADALELQDEMQQALQTLAGTEEGLNRQRVRYQAYRLASIELHLNEDESRASAEFEFQGDRYLAWLTEDESEIILRPLKSLEGELKTALALVGVDAEFSTQLKVGEIEVGKAGGGASVVTQRLLPSVEWPPVDVEVMIVNPVQYYAGLEKRRYRFGALIVVALASVGIGLTAILRALRRQQRLNQHQSNFVASVSHELRTPAASISLLAEEMQSAQGKSADYAQMIHAESQRLSCLVENVLDVSRIERKAKVYELDACDASRMLRAAVESFRPSARRSGISLKLVCPTQEIDCDLDSVAIQRALTNLMDNAVKFSRRGQSVNITLDADETEIRIAVVDHGKGIGPEEQGRIFEPFERLGTELRRETSGVGLGLALVKHVVAGHRGTIDLKSELGVGSTFLLRLPRRLKDG